MKTGIPNRFQTGVARQALGQRGESGEVGLVVGKVILRETATHSRGAGVGVERDCCGGGRALELRETRRCRQLEREPLGARRPKTGKPDNAGGERFSAVESGGKWRRTHFSVCSLPWWSVAPIPSQMVASVVSRVRLSRSRIDSGRTFKPSAHPLTAFERKTASLMAPPNLASSL